MSLRSSAFVTFHRLNIYYHHHTDSIALGDGFFFSYNYYYWNRGWFYRKCNAILFYIMFQGQFEVCVTVIFLPRLSSSKLPLCWSTKEWKFLLFCFNFSDEVVSHYLLLLLLSFLRVFIAAKWERSCSTQYWGGFNGLSFDHSFIHSLFILCHS